MRAVRLHLLCNDQYGTPEGCVRRVSVREKENLQSVITLDTIALDKPPRIAFVEFGPLKRLLRVSGRVFPILGYVHCVGMPQVDGVQMESVVAAEFLNFLKSKGTFEAQDGLGDAWEVWKAEGARFSGERLEEWA